MKCLQCKKRNAQKHPTLGILLCLSCQKTPRPTSLGVHEFIPDRILEDRKAHAKDILQPYRDGTLSKEYLKEYGTKGIQPTKDQLKGAKKVWTEDSYYKQ